MSSPNRFYYFAEATAADDAAILELLEQPDFTGEIGLMYTRRPSPVASFQRAGQAVRLLVCKDKANHQLIGFGSCAIQSLHLSGVATKVAYFSGLRVREDYRKTLFLLVDGYREMLSWSELADVDYIYTTILADNVAVQKMFEKPRRRFPTYLPIDDYCVYCIPQKRRRIDDRHYVYRRVAADELDEAIAAYNQWAAADDLSYHLSLDDFNRLPLGLKPDHFYVARQRQTGEIVACAYAWQQAAYKQHIVHGYQGINRLLPYMAPLLPLLNYPKMPRAGSQLHYYTLSFYRHAAGEQAALINLMDYIGNAQLSVNYYLVGMSSRHALNAIMATRTRITYASKVYLIDTQKNAASAARAAGIVNPAIACGLL